MYASRLDMSYNFLHFFFFYLFIEAKNGTGEIPDFVRYDLTSTALSFYLLAERNTVIINPWTTCFYFSCILLTGYHSFLPFHINLFFLAFHNPSTYSFIFSSSLIILPSSFLFPISISSRIRRKRLWRERKAREKREKG